MKSCHRTHLPHILCALILLSVSYSSAPAQTGEAKGDFLYNLSSFQGDVPFGWVRITVDRGQDEIFVIGRDDISIFNEKGMEVYRFGRQEVPGIAYDVAVKEDGTILFLTYERYEYSIVSCNFRGAPLSEIEIRGVPAEFSEFKPNRIVFRNEQLYLADTQRMMIVITDGEGRYMKGLDILKLLELEEKDRGNKVLTGFSVDSSGNILMTIAVMFKAFRLSPEGEVKQFGRAGSIPGSFNIAAGIVSDGRGNILVVDTLRCVIMVFDEEDFGFKTEFGYRGLAPGKLIAPKEIDVDSKGRVYVTQARRRGISVFRIDFTTPEIMEEVIPDQKEDDRGKEKDDQGSTDVVAVSFSKNNKAFSAKGKPATRWGDKADGSRGGNGRATGGKQGGLP